MIEMTMREVDITRPGNAPARMYSSYLCRWITYDSSARCWRDDSGAPYFLWQIPGRFWVNK